MAARPGSLADPLYFVLPPQDPLFADFLRARAGSPTASTWAGLLPSLAVCALLLALRALFNALFALYVRAGAPGLRVLQSAGASKPGVAPPPATGTGTAAASGGGANNAAVEEEPTYDSGVRSSNRSNGNSSGGGSIDSNGQAKPPRDRTKPLPSLANKVEEELWVSTGSVLLLAAGWRVLSSLPAERACGVLDTTGCLRGWPMIPVTPNVKAYYNAELGWYAHLMLKHALGLGLDDGSAMAYHHVATVALVITSYYLGVHNLGMLVFCLLNVSSPFLHASKLGNMLEMRRARVWLFVAFAAAYFVARLVLFPYVVVRVAVLNALRDVPLLTKHFLGYWLMFNALLLALCALQGLWFGAIVRILRTALSAGGGGAGGGADNSASIAAVVNARDAARGLRDKRSSSVAGVAGSGGGGGGAARGGGAGKGGSAAAVAAAKAAAAATVAVSATANDVGGGGGGGGGKPPRGGPTAGPFAGARPFEPAAANNDQGFAAGARHMIGRIVRFSSGGGGRGVIGTGPSFAERAAAAAEQQQQQQLRPCVGLNGLRPRPVSFERQPLLGAGSDVEGQQQQQQRKAAAAAAAARGGGGGGGVHTDDDGSSGGDNNGNGTGRASSLSGGAAGRRSAAAPALSNGAEQQQPVHVR